MHDLCLQWQPLRLSDINEPYETLTSVLLRASSKTQKDGGRGEKKESRVQEKGKGLSVISNTH